MRRLNTYYNYNQPATHDQPIQATLPENVQGTWAVARANNSDGFELCVRFDRIEMPSPVCTVDNGVDKACNVLLLCSVKRDGTLQKLTS